MAYISQHEAHAHLKERVIEGLKEHFPIVGRRNALHLEEVHIEDSLHPDDIRGQYEAKIQGKTWAVPVHATLALKDHKTGEVLDRKRVQVAEIPQITKRYSYIVNGQEYQPDSQWQLKPGVYAERKQDGVLAARFNVVGRSAFDVSFDPASKKFLALYNDAKLPLYPVLKAMGVDDKQMLKDWGKDIYEANRTARGADTAVERLARTTVPSYKTMPADAAAHVRQVFAESKIDPDVTEMTLGKRFSHVTGDTLHAAANKLLKVQAGNPEDDRDSLLFKNLRSIGDYVYDSYKYAKRDVHSKVTRNVDKATTVRGAVKFEHWNKPLRETFTKNSAVRIATQINPAEMLSASQQTTLLGDGGISDTRKVTDDAKLINPSHFGFIDPISTPEGATTGVTLRLASGVRKVGNEPRVAVYDLQQKKMVEISPKEMYSHPVVLADQVTWKEGHPVAVRSTVKMLGANNEPMSGSLQDARYVTRRPTHFLNVTTNLIPFVNNTNGARAGYGSRHMEQAISLVHREAPLVQTSTGVEGEVSTFAKLVGSAASHRSPVDGVVEKVTDDAIHVKDGKGRMHEVQLYRHFPLADMKSMLHSEPLVSPGDKIKTGQTLADTNYSKNGTLALGTNLTVGYLPYKGYNFEDGLVISESAAKKLSSHHLHKHEVPLREDTVLSVNKFKVHHPTAFTKDQYQNIGDDGFVAVGSKVKPGDPLVLAMNPFVLKDRSGLSTLRKSFAGTHTDASLRWHGDHEGEVVAVHKVDGKAIVHVRTVEPIQEGDKVSTFHGGKGILTKILPDKDMPHTKDGKHIDVAFNPAGVPSRMNVGQVLEIAAGKIAKKTGKPYIVENFSHKTDDVISKVQAELKQHGLSDTEELFDPISKKSLGKVLVGPQHTLKLVHQVDKKVAVRPGMTLPGIETEASYGSNLQPLGGGHAGGQAIGSLGVYALLAHGARANLREMQTFKSEGPDPQVNPAKAWPSQHNQVWAAIQTGAPLPTPKATFAFKKFENMLKGAGINIEKRGHEFILGPLTDNHVKELSSGALHDPTKAVAAKATKTGELVTLAGGIFDEKVTGGLGGNKWSHIPLAEPLPNPIFERPIKKLTGLTKTQYEDVLYGRSAISAHGKVVPLGQGTTGGAGIKSLLERIDVKKELAAQEKALATVPASKLDDTLKRVKYLKALNTLGAKTPADAYVLHNLPVLPPSSRPLAVLPSGDVKYDDINGLYRKFGMVNNQLKDSTLQRALPEHRKENLRKDFYDGVRSIMGVHIPYADADDKGLLHIIHGSSPKEGYFQKTLVSRRQDMSMRSTIIPEPSLGLDEVGLPKDAALHLFSPFVVGTLVKAGAASNVLEAQARVAGALKGKNDQGVWSALETTLKDRPVLLKRDPALHKYSVQAFRVKPMHGNAIRIHPLVTGGFGADFDGNCYIGSTCITLFLGYSGSDSDIIPELERLYSVKFGATTKILYVNEDGAFVTTTLEEVPRVEGSEVKDRNGALVYAVPAGMKVWSYDHTVGAPSFEPFTHVTVEAACDVAKVTTRRYEVTASTNDSLCVYDPVTEEVRAEFPGKAVGSLCPVNAFIPSSGTRGDWSLGWLLGAFVSDGFFSGSTTVGYSKKSVAHRDRFFEALQALQTSPLKRHTYEELHSDGAIDGASVKDHYSNVSASTYELLSACYHANEAPEGRSCLRKQLPDMSSFSTDTLVGILAGLFDGDGSLCVSNAKQKPQVLATFATSSPALVESVEMLAKLLSIRTSVSRSEPKAGRLQKHTAYTVSFSTVDLVMYLDRLNVLGELPKRAAQTLQTMQLKDDRDIVPVPNWIMQLITLRGSPCAEDAPLFRSLGCAKSERKPCAYLSRSTAVRVLQYLRKANVKGFEKWERLVMSGDVLWDIVVSVEEKGKETVYDLVVPTTKVFAVNGGLVVWDTMSAFVPVHDDAVREAHNMFPSNNLFSEASGKLMYAPSKEGTYGLYRMSLVGKDTGKKFGSAASVLDAFKKGSISHEDVVHVAGKPTTAGRALLADVLPDAMREKVLHDLDMRLDLKGTDKLLTELGKNHKNDFGDVVNRIKDIGNHAAFGVVTHDGVHVPVVATTLGLEDFKADKVSRNKALGEAATRIRQVTKSSISDKQKEEKAIQIWEEAGQHMRQLHNERLQQKPNTLFHMHQAGIKPSWDQYKQMALAPMLMKDAQGKIIPAPITKSYGEGLDVAEYWTHLHGTRRGTVRKVQEVEEPGSITKLLHNTVSHIHVDSHDCGTSHGVSLAVSDNNVHDRILQQDFKAGSTLVPAGTLITPDIAGRIRASDKNAQLIVRSPLRCESDKGVCAKCAGISSTGDLHKVGDAVGVHAVHALGERAVQLTLREFHSAGVTGSSGMASSMDRLQQITGLPEKLPNSATLAQHAGKVENVTHDRTGTNVWINGVAHFVGKDAHGRSFAEHVPGVTPKDWAPPQVGQSVQAGHSLTDPNRTVINPVELYHATRNLEQTQNHLVGEIYKLYKDEGVQRRHVETVVRAMTSVTKVKDPGNSGLVRGEIYPVSHVNKIMQQTGTKVQHVPVLRGIDMLPYDLHTDWMAKLQHQRLKETLMEAAATMGRSDIHGSHPIPGVAYGAEFGLNTTHANKPGYGHLADVPKHRY